MHQLLKLLFDKGSSAQILCVGDIMLDTFYYGAANRISPEAPIPVLRVDKKIQTLGGAGNVANNLRSLSTGVSLIGIVGHDEKGRKIQTLLKDKGIHRDGVVVSSAIQTISKNRYIAQDQQLLRVDFESTDSYDKAVTDDLLTHAKALLEKSDVLILSDYGKGALPPYVIEALLKEAQKQKKISIVDPKGIDYALYRGATFVTPNRKELKEATSLPTDTDEEVMIAAQKLIDSHGIQNVLATRSEKGMTLVKDTGECHHFKAVAKEVYDVSGAGDTVVATLAAALSIGDTLEEAVQLANLAGMVVVGKTGTATVSLQELEDAMSAMDHKDTVPDKIMTLAQAKKKVDEWKARTLKVGFTNGCFDLLHMGHLKIIKESKSLCDRLIVAVNKDASVQRAKGPERPIQNEITRASVLAALSDVDMVILFGEDTPKVLIDALIPNVLVKGGDYTVETVVGADTVQNNGGTVHLVDLVDGHSTTKTVRRIQSPT
jgi:D-beta-D-heptose 7-phosphate kinase/D-beta-D-heptose 1-phosphate adenosyltransferase